MPFSTDRDLLLVEPNLFNEVLFASQKRLDAADGIVSGTTLTSASADFAAAQVGASSVVLIAGQACEVIARVDAHTLTVSRPRRILGDTPIPPAAGTGLAVVVRTFAPQAQLVHDALLTRLGVNVGSSDAELFESQIVSLSLMTKLEVLGTLAHVYAAAVALGADNAVPREKHTYYKVNFDAACRFARVHMDFNGDGEADAIKDMALIDLLRV